MKKKTIRDRQLNLLKNRVKKAIDSREDFVNVSDIHHHFVKQYVDYFSPSEFLISYNENESELEIIFKQK
jgi:hypothetical protein